MKVDRGELVREVDAQFELVLYNGQVHEHGMANAVAFAGIAAGRLPRRDDCDACLAQKFDRTPDGLIKGLRRHLEMDSAGKPF